jgi:N-methylhydantoinase A
VIEDEDGEFSIYKSPTIPDDPERGVLDVIGVAARNRGTTSADLLSRASVFLHGTTRAINAIITGSTAKTAFLTTEGHPDILLFREGGRTEPFNFTRPFPEPYVPRRLTYEVPERIGAGGEVVKPMDVNVVVDICRALASEAIEAVAVCLLWSIVNPVHELRIGELLSEHLAGIPYTLSHRLNPTLREYRRASSTAIDASLKPVMSLYFKSLEDRLREAGFSGRLLVGTSSGGVLDAHAVAEAPIHSIGSGRAMAPVAGRYYAATDADADNAIVADTGGTSYDVSLVRKGRIPWTRETWLGARYLGHMTGFPSVDVKSIGAGGGSIAWVDEGGLLHVGPQTAGADPGPVCYGRGGTRPTVTDAALALGYIDANYFLGGTMELDTKAASAALELEVGNKLGLDLYPAAAAVLQLATEHMVRAIEEITVNQGIDPRTAVLVGGGGAAGLNVVAIARRLGCSRVVIPEVGAVLSAAGALMSTLTADFATTFYTTSTCFDAERVNAILDYLEMRCRDFIAGPGQGTMAATIQLTAEARYPHQIWELEVPLPRERFSGPSEIELLRQDFHAVHKEMFAISDPESAIEIVGWRARVQCRLRETEVGARSPRLIDAADGSRRTYFPPTGLIDTRVRLFDAMEPGAILEGPAIVESPVTTVVIEPNASATRTHTGNLYILPSRANADAGALGTLAGEVRS